MSLHEEDVLLRDMLVYARSAADAVKDKRRADLDSDSILRAAVERFIEVIGEAARRVSSERKDRLSEIPWADIVGMRNRLVHGYAEVDQDVVWKTVQDDLPRLIAVLEKELLS